MCSCLAQVDGRGLLSTIDFSWNRLAEIGCQALAEALTSNVKLERIDVSHCGINAAGAEAIAKGLSANGPGKSAGLLRVFRADCNPMGDVGREQVLSAAQLRAQLKYSLRTGSSFTDPRQLLASSQVLAI